MYSSWKDQQIVRSLEAEAVPFVKQNDIQRFFDSDWCRVLEYNSRYVFEVLKSVGSANCGGSSTVGSHDFTEKDNEIFAQTREMLDKASPERITTIAPEFTPNYEHKNIGIGFHTDCAFCRTRYVYAPNYQALPPNIEYEIWYTPINKDWYRVDQDWN